MPELPEVHTTVEGLKKVIVGKTIQEVWSDFHINTAHAKRRNIKNKKYFNDFKRRAIGAKIRSVERMGKHIIINLSNHHSIIVHMKMTGHLMYGTSDKFVHLTLKLKNPSSSSGQVAKDLVLSDMRKFASVCLVGSKEIHNHPGILELGPDPLKNLSAREFRQRIKSKRYSPIKSTLMDQTVLAGIGNIYSDEILWASAAHPLSRSAKIPDKIFNLMFSNTKKILRKSIKLGGDSMSDYRNAFGEKGSFQHFHKAYRKTGQKCLRGKCRGIIKRIVVRGRSAHFCPAHQIRY